LSSIKDLHISNTRNRGERGIDFWLYKPNDDPKPVYKCGICHEDIRGSQHCPRCYPDKPIEARDWQSFNVIVKHNPWEETGEVAQP